MKLGVHEETGEQVAVKIMDKSDIRAQEMTMNVRREIAIMKALKHRNIVNLRQVLTSASKLYIVMDLVTGGELFTKILNEGKLEENVARRYFQQLVDGIEYCHRRGVCHRDLKPENLLIDETTGELKITDFGLSAMKGASTTEELLHTQCGSPNYCAPEIIARHRQGYNGAKVDAWSCGIILFALLAGFLPFYDENTRVLYRMIQRDDVKFPRKFPGEAKDLTLKLLHKEPEKRFTLADVKKHPWFVVGYNGANSTSPPNSRRPRRARGHRRNGSTDNATKPRSASDAAPPSGKPASPVAPVAQRAATTPTTPAPPPSQNISAPIAPVQSAIHAPVPVSQPTASIAAHVPPISSSPPPAVPPPPSHTTEPVAPQPHPIQAMAPRAAVAPVLSVSANSVPVVSVAVPPGTAAPEVAAPMFVAPVATAATPSVTSSYVGLTVPTPANSAPPVPPPASRVQAASPRQSALNQSKSPPISVVAPQPSAVSDIPGQDRVQRNSIPHDSTSDSLLEAGSDVMFPAPPQSPKPTGSPMTSTSEGNVNSSGNVPVPLPTEQMSQVSEQWAERRKPVRAANSWQRNLKSDQSVPSPAPQPAEPLVVQPVAQSVEATFVPAEVPMSFVEQRKAMNNSLSQGKSTTAAPLPDMSRGPAASTWDVKDMFAPKSTPLPDMTSASSNWHPQAKITRKISAPSATLQKIFEELPMPFANGALQNGTTVPTSPEPKLNGVEPQPVPNGTGFSIPEEYEDSKEDMKRRLTAALARYRRIFKLGNNIGIMGSPSFNSNAGNPFSSGKEDKNSAALGKAEFFARAKAVTGAWGIILTQGLEEDSDSEDESRQVTEEELQAFKVLLDFWDNRRQSSKVAQNGEVILDDESAIPLSEKDISSIQSLLCKLEPKRVDEVEDVIDDEQQSEEIRQLLERDFSNPSVESGAAPGSPRPRSMSNVEHSAKNGLRLSSSVDVLPTHQRMGSSPLGPHTKPSGTIPPQPPNRKGAVFPPPPPYAPPRTEESTSQGRLTVTPSTVRDPFRPKLPPHYPAKLPTPSRIETTKPFGVGAKIPHSVSLDEKLGTNTARKSSNERLGIDAMRKKTSSNESDGSVVGPKISQVRTPSRDEHATRGMFAFSMFSRKKSNASSSFDADLPLDKCLVEVGRILQALGCSVMMKRGEHKMKCEAPVGNEKLLVSITCTHERGTTKVVFKKGRKDRSRVDAKEFYEFFQTVYNRFLERLGDGEQAS